LPDAKYAILYQNDDLGRVFKGFFKSDFDKRIVAATYEVTDPTVDSQIAKLMSFGATALIIAGTSSSPPSPSVRLPRSEGTPFAS